MLGIPYKAQPKHRNVELQQEELEEEQQAQLQQQREQQFQQPLRQQDNQQPLNEQREQQQDDNVEQEQNPDREREPFPAQGQAGNMAVRVPRPFQINMERFMLSVRIILQRQTVHFDIGGGDGILVWSWRRPSPPTGQLGQGDGDSPERIAQRQVLPTL
ncbi:uncharacterized protein Dwil_GK17555 [Drosophila willistoni]|uniref:Uncharacterized protein n=1 Tax=Drosophila willistoni TaxID=7260 RepID=B4NP97_DROWI|nr:uncharacterized protein Dwil_GK17555 [Drosophila willistoni]